VLLSLHCLGQQVSADAQDTTGVGVRRCRVECTGRMWPASRAVPQAVAMRNVQRSAVPWIRAACCQALLVLCCVEGMGCAGLPVLVACMHWSLQL
jgi:hypothetical protein